jgi:hypothetical protein
MNNLFADSEGNASSMNFVWLLSLATIIGVWIYLSLKTGQLQHVTGGDALWFTSLFSGKLVQHFFESKKPMPVSETKTGLIESDPGVISPARIIWIIAVLGIIFTWAYLTWKNTQMQHFSTGDAAWFTALFGSKVGATVIERNNFDAYSDYDESEGFERMMDDDMGTGSVDKDKLISQLQDTIKVQTDFNKNLVETINPRKNEDL